MNWIGRDEVDARYLDDREPEFRPDRCRAKRRVVIHQPFFFPWVGMFEQVRQADLYLHYDDAAITRSGGLFNRIRVKTANGAVWMTVPVSRKGGSPLREVTLRGERGWRGKHLRTLEQSYARAPHAAEMLELVADVYDHEWESLAALNIYALEAVAAYFSLSPRFDRTSELAAEGRGSAKVHALLERVGADVYITGHGARRYLDHEDLERHGIRVEYMDYQRAPYPQLHGAFDPHVSILDLIANVGREGRRWIASGTTYWKDFLD